MNRKMVLRRCVSSVDYRTVLYLQPAGRFLRAKGNGHFNFTLALLTRCDIPVNIFTSSYKSKI